MIVACQSSEQRAKEIKKKDRLFDTQRSGLEKSKQVEGNLMDAKKARDAALRKQTKQLHDDEETDPDFILDDE